MPMVRLQSCIIRQQLSLAVSCMPGRQANAGAAVQRRTAASIHNAPFFFQVIILLALGRL